MKYTVFYDQINRTNFQVETLNKIEAINKADYLYRAHRELPSRDVLEGWPVESDGEDK